MVVDLTAVNGVEDPAELIDFGTQPRIPIIETVVSIGLGWIDRNGVGINVDAGRHRQSHGGRPSGILYGKADKVRMGIKIITQVSHSQHCGIARRRVEIHHRLEHVTIIVGIE